jgi:hypothetical protein
VRVRAGTHLLVKLDAEFKGGGYTSIQVNGTAVRVLDSDGGYRYGCPSRRLTVHLIASHPGTARLTATEDWACRHEDHGCSVMGISSLPWTVAVQVMSRLA